MNVSNAEKKLQTISDLIAVAHEDLRKMKTLTAVVRENKRLREKNTFLLQKFSDLQEKASGDASVAGQQIHAFVKRIFYILNSKREQDKIHS